LGASLQSSLRINPLERDMKLKTRLLALVDN